MSDRSNLKKEDFILTPSSWWNSPPWQRNVQQEEEVAGYVASTVRKQRTHSLLFSVWSRTPFHGRVPPIFTLVLSIYLYNLSQTSSPCFYMAIPIPPSWQSRLTIISGLTFDHWKAVHRRWRTFPEGGPQSATWWYEKTTNGQFPSAFPITASLHHLP